MLKTKLLICTVLHLSVTAFSGQMTYFYPGLGACGIAHGDSDAVVALSALDFGNDINPNKAAVCGKWVKISHANGNSVRAPIWDKCPECVSGSIDVSPSVFQQIIGLFVGRTDVTWELEDIPSKSTDSVAFNSINDMAISTITVTVTVTA
jgi:expansin (peptidoglycan-binding protein)